MIRRSKRFDSNLSILQFAKEVGLKVLARPKESRERLARRVAEAISLTPEPRRSQIVAQLAGNGDNQTQGWIDVIRAPGSEHHASIRAVASTDNCLHRGCQIDHKGAKLRPRLAGARSIILRVPLLVGIGQQSVAMLELRRFMELVCWTVYFSDHPVEWRSFEAESGTGFSQDTRRPISYSAHRELGYYIEYARELMNSEASGLGIRAVDGIKQVSHELNAAVHAGQMAQATIRKPPHEDISDAAWRKFGGVQRRVFSSCCILLRNGVKTW